MNNLSEGGMMDIFCQYSPRSMCISKVCSKFCINHENIEETVRKIREESVKIE